MISRPTNYQLDRDYTKLPNGYFRMYLQDGLSKNELEMLLFLNYASVGFNCRPRLIAKQFANSQSGLKDYRRASATLKSLEDKGLLTRYYLDCNQTVNVNLKPISLNQNEKFIRDNLPALKGKTVPDLVSAWLNHPLTPEQHKTAESWESSRKYVEGFLAVATSHNAQYSTFGALKKDLEEFMFPQLVRHPISGGTHNFA